MPTGVAGREHVHRHLTTPHLQTTSRHHHQLLAYRVCDGTNVWKSEVQSDRVADDESDESTGEEHASQA